MPTKPATPKRFQCRHIFTGGHRCGSPALKQEFFCFYHHTSRKPVPKSEAQARKGRRAEFTLPRPEDRSAIQHAIGEVLLRIADHGIDARRAGLLLYGLQIASLNLPKPNPKAREEETVDEIITHPTHGDIAPEAELCEAQGRRSIIRELLDELGETDEDQTASPGQAVPPPDLGIQAPLHPDILPNLQATAEPAPLNTKQSPPTTPETAPQKHRKPLQAMHISDHLIDLFRRQNIFERRHLVLPIHNLLPHLRKVLLRRLPLHLVIQARPKPHLALRNRVACKAPLHEHLLPSLHVGGGVSRSRNLIGRLGSRGRHCAQCRNPDQKRQESKGKRPIHVFSKNSNQSKPPANARNRRYGTEHDSFATRTVL